MQVDNVWQNAVDVVAFVGDVVVGEVVVVDDFERRRPDANLNGVDRFEGTLGR